MDDKGRGARMKIHESAENYLEAILVLGQRNGQVRSIDVAAEMNFSKPSISVAMKKLREAGHIEIDSMGHITLTKAGRAIAEMVYDRHRTLTFWLTSLGVDEKTAQEDACRIEHVISEQSFNRVKEYVTNQDR